MVSRCGKNSLSLRELKRHVKYCVVVKTCELFVLVLFDSGALLFVRGLLLQLDYTVDDLT